MVHCHNSSHNYDNNTSGWFIVANYHVGNLTIDSCNNHSYSYGPLSHDVHVVWEKQHRFGCSYGS